MIMAAMAMPAAARRLDEMRDGLAGNLCRCTGYEAIYRAVQVGGAGSGRTPVGQVGQRRAGAGGRAGGGVKGAP